MAVGGGRASKTEEGVKETERSKGGEADDVVGRHGGLQTFVCPSLL